MTTWTREEAREFAKRIGTGPLHAAPKEEVEWERACSPKDRAALVLLPWEHGVTVAWRDKAGKLWGCRDIGFGVDHEACLNAWAEDAIRQKLSIEDRRGFPSWLTWLHQELGTDQWCVAARTTPNLKARYGLVLTPRRYSELEQVYRAQYGALHVIGVG